MSWRKPKTVWHWLALLSPGAVSVAMTAFGKLFLSRQNEIAPSMLGLPIALLLCVVIAFLLARGAGSAGKMIGLAFVFTAALVIVNFSIAIGGCVLMQPHLDF